MEYVDSTDDLAYITSLEQRISELEAVLVDAEFLLRHFGINWKMAGRMASSAISCSSDIRDLLHKVTA